MFGHEHVLANVAPHTGTEFSCRRYPNPDGTYLPAKTFPNFNEIPPHTTTPVAPFGAL